MKNKIHYIYILQLFYLLFCGACKKLIEIPPPVNSLNGQNVYAQNTTAAAVLTGIYNKMSSGSFASGSGSISVLVGLSADELTGTPTSIVNYLIPYTNNYISNPGGPFWAEMYSYVRTCNSAIEGITASTTLSENVKNQLLGEAKFMRAMLHFYLVNFYKNIPVVTSSDYTKNSTIAQSSETDTYNLIITDLKDAENLLSEDFLAADVTTVTSERVRPTKWAAKALLAKVYLYTKQWKNAEDKATEVISSSSFSLETNLDNVFLANSNEAIWQLQPVNTNQNSGDGNFFIVASEPTQYDNPLFLSKQLLTSFENGDNRKTSWVGSFESSTGSLYFPYKYKVKTGSTLTEYQMVFRLAELYLIRAESRAMSGELKSGLADINLIRNRAGLTGSTAENQEQLVSAILHERQVELFTEWGNRWLDLYRNNLLDEVMKTVAPDKGAVWESYKANFPIPITDLQIDHNLIQNSGY